MVTTWKVAALMAVTTILSPVVYGLPSIQRTGRYLYTPDGNRFYIKGIAYQEQGQVIASADNPFGEPSTFIDPLAQPSACSRDVQKLIDLGVNVIRVYSVNSSLNHDSCMSLLSKAGIYTIIDLAIPNNGSIDRNAPSWSTNLLGEYLATIDTFSAYDNVLAYNVGNEVVISNTSDASPFIKAAARDVKAYLKSKNNAALVGYAAINGVEPWRSDLADFLSCDPSGANSDSTSIDLYGLNDYEWCGDSNFQAAYAGTHSDFANYNVAAYFSEYGCLTGSPRLWTEVASIFSANMVDVFSGAVAFSYFPATSVQGDFGMVTVTDTSVTESTDFTNLVNQYHQASPGTTPTQANAPAASYSACPASSTDFPVSSVLPPTPNSSACNCLADTLSCQFTPATNNFSVIVGTLTDTACQLLGQQGSNCNDISSNGTTGIYGIVAECDPNVKLSYVMSLYSEANGKTATSCSFAGNGTLNTGSSVASSAQSAASSCISNPSAVFVPSAATNVAPSTSSGGGSGSSPSSPTKNKGNGALSLAIDMHIAVGMFVVTVVGAASGMWTMS